MRRQLNLSTRDARSKLPAQHKPYWREVSRGRHVGYAKGERGARWRLREFHNGRYRERTLGLADDRLEADGKTVLTWEQAAQLALNETVYEIPGKRSTGVTVKQAAEAYFKHRRSKSRSSMSVRLDEKKIETAVIPDHGDKQISHLGPADFRIWMDDRIAEAMDGHAEEDETQKRERMRKAQATANRIWANYRALLNYAHETGAIRSDEAWRHIKVFKKVDKPRQRNLSEAECKRLINASAPDFRQLVIGALQTGLRYSELIRLKAADYVDKAIVVHVSKSDVARRVPLTKAGQDFFARQVVGKTGDDWMFVQSDGEPWANALQTRRMVEACKAGKIVPKATFHDLRRTYGSLLVNSGAPLEVISNALGHADLRMTARAYAHLKEEVVRQQLQNALPTFEKKQRAKRSVKVVDINAARKAK